MPSNETTQLKTRAIYDLSGGMVTNYNFPKVAQNQVKLILNGDLTTDGSIVTRYGRSKVNSTDYGAYKVSSLTSLGQSVGADKILVGCSQVSAHFGELKTSTGVLLRALTSEESLMSAIMNDYAFFCNGVDTPFLTDGSVANTYQIGIEGVTAAQNAATFAAPWLVGGVLSTAGNHYVKFRYRSSITGARSNPNDARCVGGNPCAIGAGDQYRFDILNVAGVSTDPQVDLIDVFVTLSGAAIDSPYYFLGTTNNSMPPDPTGVGPAIFDVSDAELMVREVLDIDDNVAPSELRDIENFKGRMVGITGDYTIRYSKRRVDQNGVVNLPTSWPATNEINIGWGDGDPLVKIVKFNDMLFAFKRRSIWLFFGDFDSDMFEFKQLKTNITNVGLLNKRCAVAAGDSMYFVSDDLKLQRFKSTDFSSAELRLQDPPPSDKVANLFTQMASAYRQYVNIVNFTFAQYTQIWISFSDGSTGAIAADNYSVFVFDYTSGGNEGAWHIHTGHEVASSVLARAADNNYYIYTGDYSGYLWQHDQSIGDGTSLNFTGWFPAAGNILMCHPVGQFTSLMDGCLIRCTSAPEATLVNEVRRGYYLSANEMMIVPSFSTVGSGTGGYFTIGGIDFQVQSRDDWLDDGAPVDYEKQGWYLDLDITSENLVTLGTPPINELDIILYKNRTDHTVSLTKGFDYSGAVWGSAIWGVDIWPEAVAYGIQVGINLYFQQVSHKIVSQIAGQRLRVHGWTYHFQQLGKLRLK